MQWIKIISELAVVKINLWIPFTKENQKPFQSITCGAM